MPKLTIMRLSEFNDFFGTFSTLNLAFGGSQIFKSIIDDTIKILRTPRKLQIELQKIQAKKTVAQFQKVSFRQKTEAMQKKAIEEYEAKVMVTDKIYDTRLEYPKAFDSVFLFAAFFSIAMMILAGYQDSFDPDQFLTCLAFLAAAFLINLGLFFRCFSEKKDKIAGPFHTIIGLITLFFLALLVDAIFTDFHWKRIPGNIELTIGFCLLITLSPYVFHFCRIYYYKTIFTRERIGQAKTCIRTLEDLNKADDLFIKYYAAEDSE